MLVERRAVNLETVRSIDGREIDDKRNSSQGGLLLSSEHMDHAATASNVDENCGSSPALRRRIGLPQLPMTCGAHSRCGDVADVEKLSRDQISANARIKTALRHSAICWRTRDSISGFAFFIGDCC